MEESIISRIDFFFQLEIVSKLGNEEIKLAQSGTQLFLCELFTI